MKFHIPGVLCLVLCWLTACPSTPNPQTPTPTPIGTPVGAISSKTIGVTGGMMSSSDGTIQLEIPAGAIAGELSVGIQEITNNAPGRAGKAFRLTPEGTVFSKPVKLRFAYTDEEIVGSVPQLLSIAYQDAKGVWQMYRKPVLDNASKTITVETTHFSDWSKVEGSQLLPNTAKVKVGQSLQLKIVHCANYDDPDDIFIPLPGGETNECVYNIANLSAKNWAVNAKTGGNSSVGTVSATGTKADGTATYTAPATKPSKNPVAVSVEVADLTQEFSSLTLVANITIEDNAGWTGKIKYHEEGSIVKAPSAPMTGHVQDAYSYDETQEITKTNASAPEYFWLDLNATSSSTYFESAYTREESKICSGGYVTEHWWETQENLTGRETRSTSLYVASDGSYSITFSSVGTKGVRKSNNRDKVTAVCPPPDPSYDTTSSSENSIGRVGKETVLQGKIDPKTPNKISGKLEFEAEQDGIPTRVMVTWDILRN